MAFFRRARPGIRGSAWSCLLADGVDRLDLDLEQMLHRSGISPAWWHPRHLEGHLVVFAISVAFSVMMRRADMRQHLASSAFRRTVGGRGHASAHCRRACRCSTPRGSAPGSRGAGCRRHWRPAAAAHRHRSVGGRPAEVVVHGRAADEQGRTDAQGIQLRLQILGAVATPPWRRPARSACRPPALADSAQRMPMAGPSSAARSHDRARRGPWDDAAAAEEVGVARDRGAARPVPFWRNHFALVRSTRCAPLTLCVPARRLASCQLTTRCRMSARTRRRTRRRSTSAADLRVVPVFDLAASSPLLFAGLRVARVVRRSLSAAPPSGRGRERHALRQSLLDRIADQDVAALGPGTAPLTRISPRPRRSRPLPRFWAVTGRRPYGRPSSCP